VRTASSRRVGMDRPMISPEEAVRQMTFLLVTSSPFAFSMWMAHARHGSKECRSGAPPEDVRGPRPGFPGGMPRTAPSVPCRPGAGVPRGGDHRLVVFDLPVLHHDPVGKGSAGSLVEAESSLLVPGKAGGLNTETSPSRYSSPAAANASFASSPSTAQRTARARCLPRVEWRWDGPSFAPAAFEAISNARFPNASSARGRRRTPSGPGRGGPPASGAPGTAGLRPRVLPRGDELARLRHGLLLPRVFLPLPVVPGPGDALRHVLLEVRILEGRDRLVRLELPIEDRPPGCRTSSPSCRGGGPAPRGSW